MASSILPLLGFASLIAAQQACPFDDKYGPNILVANVDVPNGVRETSGWIFGLNWCSHSNKISTSPDICNPQPTDLSPVEFMHVPFSNEYGQVDFDCYANLDVYFGGCQYNLDGSVNYRNVYATFVNKDNGMQYTYDCVGDTEHRACVYDGQLEVPSETEFESFLSCGVMATGNPPFGQGIGQSPATGQPGQSGFVQGQPGQPGFAQSAQGQPPNQQFAQGGLPPTQQFSQGQLPPNQQFSQGGLPPTQQFSQGGLPPTQQFGQGGLPPTQQFSQGGQPPAQQFGVSGPVPNQRFSQAGQPPTQQFSQGGLPPTQQFGVGGSPPNQQFSAGRPPTQQLSGGAMPPTGQWSQSQQPPTQQLSGGTTPDPYGHHSGGGQGQPGSFSAQINGQFSPPSKE